MSDGSATSIALAIRYLGDVALYCFKYWFWRNDSLGYSRTPSLPERPKIGSETVK